MTMFRFRPLDLSGIFSLVTLFCCTTGTAHRVEPGVTIQQSTLWTPETVWTPEELVNGTVILTSPLVVAPNVNFSMKGTPDEPLTVVFAAPEAAIMVEGMSHISLTDVRFLGMLDEDYVNATGSDVLDMEGTVGLGIQSKRVATSKFTGISLVRVLCSGLTECVNAPEDSVSISESHFESRSSNTLEHPFVRMKEAHIHETEFEGVNRMPAVEVTRDGTLTVQYSTFGGQDTRSLGIWAAANSSTTVNSSRFSGFTETANSSTTVNSSRFSGFTETPNVFDDFLDADITLPVAAIWASDVHSLAVTNSIFENNTIGVATEFEGGVYIDGSSNGQELGAVEETVCPESSCSNCTENQEIIVDASYPSPTLKPWIRQTSEPSPSPVTLMADPMGFSCRETWFGRGGAILLGIYFALVHLALAWCIYRFWWKANSKSTCVVDLGDGREDENGLLTPTSSVESPFADEDSTDNSEERFRRGLADFRQGLQFETDRDYDHPVVVTTGVPLV